jgi:hypothetical protein
MSKFMPCCIGLIVMFMGPAAVATEPGTPMNCTDLLLAPGLNCSQFSNPGQGAFFRQNESVVDNDGRILTYGDGSVSDIIRELGSCGTNKIVELALVYRVAEGGVRTPIASVNQRCLDPSTSTSEGLRLSSILFDSVNGTLIILLNSTCGPSAVTCNNYGGGNWIAHINGFTPLTDALPKPPLAPALCKNGVDDDGDGAIDMDDVHCKSPEDNDESRP